MNRKYLSEAMSPGDSCSRIARDSGPCSASAAVRSETSSIVTCNPTAFIDNHRRFGSALVRRKVLSASRLTVPSSMTFPRASHHGVYSTCPT